jgi:hypothetical protein
MALDLEGARGEDELGLRTEASVRVASDRPIGRVRDEEGWMVCLSSVHVVRGGMVDCPIRRSRVTITDCLLCHHLETLAGERDDASCATAEVTPSPRPR